MPRMNRLSPYATTVSEADGETVVIYHTTRIVTFNHDCVTLRTGGWDTVTTRRKMNQASNQFGLGYSVFRRDGDSYVSLPDGSETPLYDVVTFQRRA